MSVRSWLLRRAMGRFRLTDDIVRHLSTFQRLGETVEVEFPGELLPVGARTVFRAVRTRAAAQIGHDWVWPYWLQRQLDPTSPAFVPRGHLPVLTNVTARNWTGIGNIGSSVEAIVDPRGLLTPWFDGWSLDWWIGGDDRWYVPSREPSVRQGLLGSSPVVETSIRLAAGGDAVHRAYCIPGADELAIVEIENRSPVPFAAAFGVRPYNPEGLAVVERIEIHDRVTVTVDGRPALLFPQPPSRMAGSVFHDGDVASTVFAGEATADFPAKLRCDVGLATAAFVVPVPHGATVRVAVPLVAKHRTRRHGLARRRASRAPAFPTAVPSGAAAARGWDAHARRGMRVDLPPGRLADAVEANRRFMLLLHDGGDITPGPYTYHRFWFRDAAYMVTALDRFGFHDEAGEVIANYASRQRSDGFFFSQRQEWDANGAALWSTAEHWRLTRDSSCIDVESVVAAAEWIQRKRRRPSRARRRADPVVEGLLPAGVSAEHLGPFDFYYWDDFWCARGLLDAAELLDAAGETTAAAQARGEAAAFRDDIGASLRSVADRLGTLAIPAGPLRRIDAGVIGSLVACSPLGLLDPHDPAIEATLDVVRDRFCLGPAFFQGISHTGLGTYLTLQVAAVELERGEAVALDRLQWMLEAATDTFTWPEAVHPHMLGGCMGDGHHGWAAADFLSFVRSLLVRETSDRGLALCSLLPGAWEGQAVEVHDAPTHFGRLSYAVRWHGDRPAILWELDPHGDIDRPVPITAPGLDPSFRADTLTGDALLAPRVPR